MVRAPAPARRGPRRRQTSPVLARAGRGDLANVGALASSRSFANFARATPARVSSAGCFRRDMVDSCFGLFFQRARLATRRTSPRRSARGFSVVALETRGGGRHAAQGVVKRFASRRPRARCLRIRVPRFQRFGARAAGSVSAMLRARSWCRAGGTGRRLFSLFRESAWWPGGTGYWRERFRRCFDPHYPFCTRPLRTRPGCNVRSDKTPRDRRLPLMMTVTVSPFGGRRARIVAAARGPGTSFVSRGISGGWSA